MAYSHVTKNTPKLPKIYLILVKNTPKNIFKVTDFGFILKVQMLHVIKLINLMKEHLKWQSTTNNALCMANNTV